MQPNRTRAFTLAEIIVAATVSGMILVGVMSTFLMFVRSSIRISNYDQMETKVTQALEILARDARMAQKIETIPEVPSVPAADRNIQELTLTVPKTDGSGITDVTYKFDTVKKILTRQVTGGTAQTLITDIVDGEGDEQSMFLAFNLNQAIPGTLNEKRAANDYETNQIMIRVTSSPDTKGLYASTTRRIISARFVLRNK